MDDEERRRVAIWKATVLGPLVSARLEHGDLQEQCAQAAARQWEHPDGRLLTLSERTIENWYYAHRAGGLGALEPQTRSDAGQSRVIRPEVADLLIRAKRERPRRSIRRLIKMLVRARQVRAGELTRSSVHRLLQRKGLSGRPGREGATKERLAWSAEHGGDIWVGDALHLRNPVLGPDGALRKAYLLSQIDSATRLICFSYAVLGEGAVEHEYGLREAIMRHGLPRTYYVDRGSAYVAGSLKTICAELGIHLTWAGKGDGAAKGVIERWHRTWREEVEEELPDEPLTLEDLNALHWAWLNREYHRRVHGTTGRQPLQHMLEEAEHGRDLPRQVDLSTVFMHRDRRTVRRDSTVSWRGQWLEVHWKLQGREVELRFDPHVHNPKILIFQEGDFVCEAKVLDRVQNARRGRRKASAPPSRPSEPSGLDPLRQLAEEHYHHIDAWEPEKPGRKD